MRYFHYKFLWLGVLLIVGFTSCSLSLTKRRYRPGYYIEVSKPVPHHVENMQKEVQLGGIMANQAIDSTDAVTEDSPIKLKDKVEEVKSVPSTTENLLGDDSCDVIYMVMGQRIHAKVIEIGENYVSYKKCDDLKGRLYTVKSKDIDNITLGNGEYYIPKDRIVFDKDKERKKSQTLFVMSIIALSIAFVCFVFSFFIVPFSILSFIFSIIDLLFSFILMMINIRPSRFTPSWRTRLAWLFLAIALILLIAAFVLVLI